VAAKTLGPAQVLEFMGIVLDSNRMEARLPDDKLTRISQLLDSFTGCRSARLVDLQFLIGTLQFACKVVVPGRTFLQRMINLTRGSLTVFTISALTRNFSGTSPCGKLLLQNGMGAPFSLIPISPLPPTWNFTLMLLVQWVLGVISMADGFRADGPRTS